MLQEILSSANQSNKSFIRFYFSAL